MRPPVLSSKLTASTFFGSSMMTKQLSDYHALCVFEDPQQVLELVRSCESIV